MKKKFLLGIIVVFIFPSLILSQQVEWIKHYDYAGSDDTPFDMTIDHSGNCYVTGRCHAGFFDAVTIKYKPNGDTAWVRSYHDPSGGTSEPYALTVDASGNVYVTGRGTEGITYYNYFTIKYDSIGTQEWYAYYSGLPGLYLNDEAYDIVVDNAGNAYVTGSSDTTVAQDNSDIVTIKYSPAGETLWVRRYDAALGSSFDLGMEVEIDKNGDVIVAGVSENAMGDLQPVVIKYTSSGNFLWETRYPGDVYIYGYSILPLHPISLCVDTSRYIYIATNTPDSLGYRDYLTIKYDPDGNEVWSKTYASIEGDDALALKVDLQGNVYVTGRVSGGAYKDIVTLKYDPNGYLLWTAYYNGPVGEHDIGFDLDLDICGNVYVAGLASTASSNTDFVTIKYDSGGSQDWVVFYDGAFPASPDQDKAFAIAVDDSGNVWITGESDEEGGDFDFTTIKYRKPLGLNEELFLSRGKEIFFAPSLFKDKIFLKFAESSKSPLKITLYNSYGALVFRKDYPYTPLSLTLEDGKIRRLRSGIYFLSVSSGIGNFLGKMKLIKFQ